MKKYDELALVEEYKKCNRCRVVAEKYGCSDETVRRALIKYNVPRIQRNPRPHTKKPATEEELMDIVAEYYCTDTTINDLAQKYKRAQGTISNAIKKYGHGLKLNAVNGRKILDSELIEEAKTKSAIEIAVAHGMSEERVYRRAKKLGIKVNQNGAGGKHKRRCNRYGGAFDSTITLRALYKRDDGICQICGKPTNPEDIKNGHIGRLYPTIDHIYPVSKGGNHTWDNVQLAHMYCNSGKCDKVV